MMRIAEALAERFGLNETERAVLQKNVVDLDRRGRRLYHRAIEPRLDELRLYVRQLLERERRERGPQAAGEWATAVGLGIVGKGYASIADRLVMDVVGRRAVADVVRAARGSALFD